MTRFAVARSRRNAVLAVLALGISLFLASRAAAAPVVGFEENFGSGTGTWFSTATLSNPGTGGYDGTGDGFLLITRATGGNFGAHSQGAEYTGDWIAAGITQVRLWLNDVGTASNFEMHLTVGTATNGWQYNIGF